MSFVDMNPGMNRTGVEQGQADKVVRLVRGIGEAGLEFRGLHYYDGQYGGLDDRERTAAAHAGYDRLLELVARIGQSGVSVPEVITAGTPDVSFLAHLSGFSRGRIHPSRLAGNCCLLRCDQSGTASPRLRLRCRRCWC